MKATFSSIVLGILALSFTTGCPDGSNIVKCESDNDCTEDQVCDLSAEEGQCINPVCKEDNDCRLSSPDSATSEDDCSACEAGDRCVKDALDTTYCVTEGDAATCADISTEAVTLTDTDGADFTGCLVDSSCEGYTCNDA